MQPVAVYLVNGWNITSSLSFINMLELSYSDEIRNTVLVMHGEKAHSRYFSEDAFKKLNKKLLKSSLVCFMVYT